MLVKYIVARPYNSFMFSSIPSQEGAVVFVVTVDIWGECENRSQHIFPWRPLHVCTVSRCYFEVFFSPAPRDPAVVKQHSGDFLFDLPAAIIIVSTSFSLQWCSFAAAGSISHSHQFIFYRSLERFSWILLFFDNPAPLIGNWVKDSPPFLDTLRKVEKDLWWFLGGCNTFQETTRLLLLIYWHGFAPVDSTVGARRVTEGLRWCRTAERVWGSWSLHLMRPQLQKYIQSSALQSAYKCKQTKRWEITSLECALK